MSLSATNPTAAAIALPSQAYGNNPDLVEEEASEMPEMVKLQKQEGVLETVFVGGLPPDASKKDVQKAFEEAGEVVDIRMAKDPMSNKGFAFVRFATAEQARKAATGFKGN